MKTLILRLLIFIFVCLSFSERMNAGVIITYQDVGSNLQFDYAGTLGFDAFGNIRNSFATVSSQNGISPVFYSSGYSDPYSRLVTDRSINQTVGAFATNLPVFTNRLQGTRSGTALLFRLNGGAVGPASSIDIWGGWGAADTPFSGRLTLTGQSASAIGMVDGWNVETDFGSITFQDAASLNAVSLNTVPEPTSMAIFGIGALGLLGVKRRKKKQASCLALT